MITIYTPKRTSTGLKANVSFDRSDNAQAWIDRQVSLGDDGDWAVSSSYVYTSLDEHDRDKGTGAYRPKGNLRNLDENGAPRRVPYSVQAALRREQEEQE